MRKFIAIQVERATEDGTPRNANLVYIKDPTLEQKATTITARQSVDSYYPDVHAHHRQRFGRLKEAPYA